MEQEERLPIMGANTDLEANLSRVAIGDDAAHLEAADFAGEHSVFLDGFGAARADEVAKTLVGGIDRCVDRVRFDERWNEQAIDDMPHIDRHGELRCLAGEYSRRRVGDDRQAASPRRTERTRPGPTRARVPRRRLAG